MSGNPERSTEAEFRQVLAEMSLLQYGKTQSFDSSGGKDSDRDPRPSGEAHPMADHYSLVWGYCVSDNDRREVLRAAREELSAWKVRTAPAVSDDSTLEDWVVEDGEGFAVAQVASKFGIAETRVRRIRMRAERESEFGLPLRFAAVASPERIRNLAAQGCTERQIAFQVGVSKSTVRRALGRAA
jgi:hypothetical protein